MHWLLQSNLSTEEGQRPFTEALDHLVSVRPTASWSFVKLVPFAGTVEPLAPAGKRIFPLGSTSMTTASQIYNWDPGVIYDPVTFDYSAWLKGWGRENLINGDGEVCFFGAAKATEKVFMRPTQDLKAFSGLTLNPDELEDWQQRVFDGESSTRTAMLTMATPVLVAPVKVILREWRFFVVDGALRGWSQYAAHGRRDRDGDVPPDVRAYAQKLVDQWQPAACFVLDIGETKDGLGAIEVNTLNSSGVYACDVRAIFTAIEDFYEST